MDLREAPLFAHFDRGQIALLGACGTRRKYPAGTRLLPDSDGRHHLMVILRGKVRLHRETPYGPFRLATLGSGSLLGEIGLLDPDLASLDVSAESDVEALVLDNDQLKGHLDSNPAFQVALYWALWKSLSLKLRDCNEKLTRFFSQGPGNQGSHLAGQRDASGEFRIDIETKRAVFREQRLSNMEINFLASLSKAQQLPANEVLFREGDDGDRLFVVVEGRIMISKNIPGAGEEALAFLERGEFFGEMALIDKAPRSADAKADRNGAIVLSIHRDVLGKVLNIEKVSSIRLLSLLCHMIAGRLRDAHEKIVGWYILSGGGAMVG